jgi:isoaspartyl peptidase/L-asparaginase-like protein (Ntn-hydrolase superfamily)
MVRKQVTPAAIATWNFGKEALEVSGKILSAGGGAIEAVEKGINVIELDPNEQSVGYGGLPNADGVVEVDAAIMEGRKCNAGSVAGLKHIKRPISVARRVMEGNPHAMLVGDGALMFAIAQGFKPENLLTDAAKTKWKAWREKQKLVPSGAEGIERGHDTIGLVALDANGDIAAGCSTSGLGYKPPGRVGDSPLIGSGLYADNDAGGAAATGLGEEILKFCACFLAVEFMRNGDSPMDACAKVIARILKKKPENENVGIALVALSKHGEFGAASTGESFPYAIWTPEVCEVRTIKRQKNFQ